MSIFQCLAGKVGAVRRQGMLRCFRNAVVRTWHRLFRKPLLVWVWTRDCRVAEAASDIGVERYANGEQLPRELIEQLIAGGGTRLTANMRDEFAAGGVLWVGLAGGAVAGYQWSRTGDRLGEWYLPLTAADVLVYSTVTFHDFRGLGIGPAILARICREEVGPNGRAVSICRAWNTASTRFLQKSGFQKVAEQKPLPGHVD